MIYPYIKLVVPTALKGVENGKLPDNLLAPVKTGGKLYAPVAEQFNKLYDAALSAGFKLKQVGNYRSYQDQYDLFMSRYSKTDEGRVPQVTRKFEGATWYLKPKMAPAGTPGTSNHGLGLAIDLGYEKAGKTTSMGGACLEWMCANAPSFGFYLQGSDPKSKEFEAWHWQYCLGDNTPNGAPAPVAPSAPAGAPELSPKGTGIVLNYPGSPVRRGSKGDSVKLVQTIVGATPVDGDFGPGTEAKVKAWQLSNGLATDGVVGPVSWKKMFG